MRIWYFILICSLSVILGCKKELKYVVDGPVNPKESNVPDTFSIMVHDIQDMQAGIHWTGDSSSVQDSMTYEVSLGDSVIAYNLKLTSLGYTIYNLLPDHDYSVTVAAVNRDRICRKVSATFHTMKFFIDSVFYIQLNYDDYFFVHGIKTTDRGFLLYGHAENYHKKDFSTPFLLKLNKDLSIDWLREVPWTITSLYETKDGSYLATSRETFLRYDQQGNELWAFTFPEIDKVNLHGSFDNMSGDVFAFGHASRNPNDSTVRDEYFISKFSGDGMFIRKQFGGTTLYNYPTAGIQLPDGNLVLYGQAELTGNNPGSMDWETANWLLTLNPELNFISEHFYPNDMIQRGDKPYSFLLQPDNGFILFGTTFGLINGFSESMARFMKINPDYSVGWDKKYYLSSGGYTPGLGDYDIMPDGNFLVLCHDDRGLNISILSSSGECLNQVKLYGFMGSFLIRYVENEGVVLLFLSGEIFHINLDGYTGNLKSDLSEYKLTEKKTEGRKQ